MSITKDTSGPKPTRSVSVRSAGFIPQDAETRRLIASPLDSTAQNARIVEPLDLSWNCQRVNGLDHEVGGLTTVFKCVLDPVLLVVDTSSVQPASV
jgi:hypothetical protein